MSDVWWLIFPGIQVALSLGAAIMIWMYSSTISAYLGGGVISKITWVVVILALFLALHTILGLLSYFTGDELFLSIRRMLVLLLSIGEIWLAVEIKKFAEGLESFKEE